MTEEVKFYLEVAKEQMELLPYYNTFFKTSTPPAAFLAEIISELTPEYSQPTATIFILTPIVREALPKYHSLLSGG